MSINKIVLLFLFTTFITFSQTKKKADTVFVYQKVIVYKTISKKIHFEGFDSIAKKRMSEIIHFKSEIDADTSFLKTIATSIKKDSKKMPKKWFAIDHYGFSIQTLYSQLPEVKSYGAGIGLFVTKNIYKNKFFLTFEFLYSKVMGSPNTNSTEGYYFTPDAALFYKPSNISTRQINLPITLSWKYKKIKPQMGVAYTNKQTLVDLVAYKNNTTNATSEKANYKLTNSYIDFIYGAEYELTEKINLFLKSKQSLVKTENNAVSKNLKPLEELHFFPNQVIFGISYNLK